MPFTPPALETLEPEQATGGFTPPPLDSIDYDTPLAPAEEPEFQEWKSRVAPSDSGANYDLRGAFKARIAPDPLTGHWPDTFKKPSHPTFSDQSIYAPTAPHLAGHWEGEKYVPPLFTPPPLNALEASSLPDAHGDAPTWFSRQWDYLKGLPAEISNRLGQGEFKAAAKILRGAEWGIGRLYAVGHEIMPNQTPSDLENSVAALGYAADQIEKFADTNYKPDPKYAHDLTANVTQMVGDVGVTLGFGKVLTVPGAFGLSAGQHGREEALALGKPDQADTAFLTQGAIGALAGGIFPEAEALHQFTQRPLREIAKAGVHGSGVISGQTAASNAAAQATYDPERSLTAGLGEAALTGGILAGGMRALPEMLNRRGPAERTGEMGWRPPGIDTLEPEVRTIPETRMAEPPAAAGGLQIEPGGIPIEQLPGPISAARTHAETAVSFRADEAIPFMSKVRIEDQLTARGLTDPEIAALTTFQVQELLAQEPPAATSRAERSSREPIATEPPRTTSGELSPEMRAEAEYRAQLLEEARASQEAQGAELIDAVARAGGLPSRENPNRQSFVGELARIDEAARDPRRREKIPLNRIFRADAPGIDELATSLRDQGFDIRTPGDLLNLVEQRLASDRPMYGTPESARTFASGSAAPPRRVERPPVPTVEEFQGDYGTGTGLRRPAPTEAGSTEIAAGKAELSRLGNQLARRTEALQQNRSLLGTEIERAASEEAINLSGLRSAEGRAYARDLIATYADAARGGVLPQLPRIPLYRPGFERHAAEYHMAAQYAFDAVRANVARLGIDPKRHIFASGSARPREESPYTLAGEEGVDLAAARYRSSQAETSNARSGQGKVFATGAAGALPQRTPRALTPPGPPAPSSTAVQGAIAPVRSWWQQRTLGIRKLVGPQTIDTPARQVANIVRDYNGQLANRIAQADEALNKARADFDRTPVPSNWKYDPSQPLPRNYAFMAESERGGVNLSASDRALKSQLDKMFEEAVDEVHRVKPEALQSLIQDYFPHVWRDPKAAQQAFASIIGTRPMEGSKSFLKKRSLAYIEDGLKRGLRPITDNPVEMVLTKLHEIHKFVAAQDMLAEAKAIGARKFVYIFEKAPEGWVKVDDPTSTVHGPPFVTVPEAFDEQMKVKTVELLDSLGIKHERVRTLGGKRWGTYATGNGGVRTKFAGPLSVYWHELGHGLQERYGWLSEILRGENPGGQSHVSRELRNLANLRGEGQQLDRPGFSVSWKSGTKPDGSAKFSRKFFTDRTAADTFARSVGSVARPGTQPTSFASYIRSADEKAAVMLEAYIHAPRRMQEVAPVIFGRVKKFIAAHPELRAIEEVRPSLVLGNSKQRIDVSGMVTLGHYYMPEGAATVFNNYLMPGLQRFGIIRNIRTSTNILSGMQLGFSAFHAGFTSIDAAVSQFALALRYASEGKIGKAIAKTLTAPLAPVANYYTGKAVQKAMLVPEWAGRVKVLGHERQLSAHGEAVTNEIAQLAVKAGLRATVDPFWKTQITRNMVRAWHEGGVKGYAGTILRVPFALSEQMMRPILEYLVPRQKLGVFAGMARQHMERLGPNADIHAVRDALARAADSTEDRMGQMTYDNLFYSRMVRDAALIGFRAYGWTFGKYRALFGGLADTLSAGSRLKAGEPVLTDRMAYLIALPMVAAAIGSVMNYTMTGETPRDWKDALMPRTGRLDRHGNPQRLSLPTYIKDILSDWHDFPNTKKMLESFSHKLNPWFSVAHDIIANADFFGTKVYNEDDPFWKQQADKALFVIKSARPFAVTSTLRLSESNPPLEQQVLPFFGFLPAKAALTMTPTQLRAAELMGDMLPRGARTQEQAAHSKLRSDLIRQLREDEPGVYGQLLARSVSKDLNKRDVSRITKALETSPLQYQVKRLPLAAAMKVWDLASAQERDQLRLIIFKKFKANKTTPADEKLTYWRAFMGDARSAGVSAFDETSRPRQ